MAATTQNNGTLGGYSCQMDPRYKELGWGSKRRKMRGKLYTRLDEENKKASIQQRKRNRR